MYIFTNFSVFENMSLNLSTHCHTSQSNPTIEFNCDGFFYDNNNCQLPFIFVSDFLFFLYHLILLNCALFRLLRPYFLPSFLDKMWNTWLNNLLHHINEWKCLLFMITFLLLKKEQINLKSNNERTNWSIMNIDTQSEQKKGILEVDCWGSYVHSSSMH